MPLKHASWIGLMKDECFGFPIKEFVSLRSKMYSIRMEDDREIKKSKGVKSSVIKQQISFDDYLHTIRNKAIIRKKQKLIKSKLHKVFTITQNKIVLSHDDDKRFLLPNSTDTLAHGHKNISNIYKLCTVVRDIKKNKKDYLIRLLNTYVLFLFL